MKPKIAITELARNEDETWSFEYVFEDASGTRRASATGVELPNEKTSDAAEAWVKAQLGG